MEKTNQLERTEKLVVCVTGASGFVASWLINLLLSSGYSVHATVRTDPCDSKYEHLKQLDKASEKLKLFKAYLLDYDSVAAAIKGCIGVFHVASPVPSASVSDPEVQLMEPAVKGTLNVLKASSEEKVKRVVYVSSVAAVLMNPDWQTDQVKDENCWSDIEFCKRTNNWYCASKTEAENEAFEYSKRSGLNVVSVCPTLVLGPMMQSNANASSLVLIKLLKEGYESTENKLRMIVDVRDLTAALLMVFEKPEAEGRYICSSHQIRVKELVDKLTSIYPHYNYPKTLIEVADGDSVSSEKLQKLGWSYRPLEETLVDSVESYKKLGLLGWRYSIGM
ncbi:cinnamoyl-CoA reductase 2-like [Chenopodium quinoa]|uniref:cinnamoyl-CoA reductase 2-like n=1 Tax=Chenopodium quinoa TaxID=63459 RepID=UPI000B776A3B|nr:cinnamoyl-CoA reductase 2-like [Chenopodium quinoa]